jgi:hypothetical protein
MLINLLLFRFLDIPKFSISRYLAEPGQNLAPLYSSLWAKRHESPRWHSPFCHAKHTPAGRRRRRRRRFSLLNGGTRVPC